MSDQEFVDAVDRLNTLLAESNMIVHNEMHYTVTDMIATLDDIGNRHHSDPWIRFVNIEEVKNCIDIITESIKYRTILWHEKEVHDMVKQKIITDCGEETWNNLVNYFIREFG